MLRRDRLRDFMSRTRLFRGFEYLVGGPRQSRPAPEARWAWCDVVVRPHRIEFDANPQGDLIHLSLQSGLALSDLAVGFRDGG